jgi:hypothetical protein
VSPEQIRCRAHVGFAVTAVAAAGTWTFVPAVHLDAFIYTLVTAFAVWALTWSGTRLVEYVLGRVVLIDKAAAEDYADEGLDKVVGIDRRRHR